MALRHKLALAFGLLFTLMIAVLWLALKLQLEQTLSQQTRTLGEILAKQTADSVTELVLANDLLGLNVVLSQLAREPGINSVTVADVDGVVLASTRPAMAIAGTDSYQAPITLQDAVAGRVTLIMDRDLLSNPLIRPHTIFYASILLALILVSVFSWLIANQYNQTLRRLVDLVDAPETFDPETLELPADDAARQVQNRMLDLMQRVQSLEDRIEATGLPDPEELAGLALRTERRMSSILVVEAMNIHTAVELLHPATLSTLLQEFQFYLRQAARLYRGVVMRMEGARALVAFDTQHCQDEHAFGAICCGQLFLGLMQKIAERHKANAAQSLEFRLVVHSGDAYFSPVWKKKRNGVEATREESIIGKPVELAYALLPSVPGGKLLVSVLSLELAGGASRFDQPFSLEVHQGQDKPSVMTYILGARHGAHADLLQRQTSHLLPEKA
jgi:uncharacterized membrane protein affecting hemolysin expression/class 3 adenylate cyclase